MNAFKINQSIYDNKYFSHSIYVQGDPYYLVGLGWAKAQPEIWPTALDESKPNKKNFPLKSVARNFYKG